MNCFISHRSVTTIGNLSTRTPYDQVSSTMFSLRIVTVDSYQNSPIRGFDVCYSDFRGCEIFKVPVIRIFGVTPTGQKGCLHVHGVFPYLTLQWKDVFPGVEVDNSRRYTQDLALDIDKALNVAARNSNSSRHHVFKIDMIKGICFYGYHPDEEDFLRIYFYNPFDVNRTTELLTNGVIMNKFIQPHEAHFPYILQFFSDYNLSGMNLINVSKFKFRLSDETFMSALSPLRTQSLSSLLDDSTLSVDKVWSMNTLPSSQISNIQRETRCELELDCRETDILNKSGGNVCVGKNPGIAAIWEEERQRRRIEKDSSQFTQVSIQERVNVLETESEIHYKRMLHIILENHRLKPSEKFDEVAEIDLNTGSQSSQNSFLQSFDFSNSQDQELLGMVLSMANHHGPEDDSILACGTDSDSLKDDEEETKEMSQRFADECLNESWTSQILNSQAPKENTSSEMPPVTLEQDFIPQLDGAFDDEDYEKFANSQDQELLGMVLSMANHHGPEDDSILACGTDSDSLKDDEEEIKEMSQRFADECLNESWTSQILNSQVPKENTSSEMPPLTLEQDFIPQLDGAFDDEDYEKFGPMLLKEENRLGSLNQREVSEFNEEPPVLQPVHPLMNQNIYDLEKSWMMRCSVKVEKHPILKQVDPSKPVPLTILADINDPLPSSKKLQQENEYSILNRSSKQIISAVKSESPVKNCKNSSRDQKFPIVISKCVSSLFLEAGTVMDDGDHSMQTANDELTLSQVRSDFVLIPPTEQLKPSIQLATKPNFKNNCTIDFSVEPKSTDSEATITSMSSKNHLSPVKSKSTNKYEFPSEGMELCEINPSQIKSYNIEESSELLKQTYHSDLFVSSDTVSNSITKFETESSKCEESPKSRLSGALVNSSKSTKGAHCGLLAQNLYKKERYSAYTRYNSSASNSVKDTISCFELNANKKKFMLNNIKNRKSCDVESQHLFLDDSCKRTSSPDGAKKNSDSLQSVNFSQFGQEMVVLEKLTKEDIANYLKEPSLNYKSEPVSSSKLNHNKSSSAKLKYNSSLKNTSKSRSKLKSHIDCSLTKLKQISSKKCVIPLPTNIKNPKKLPVTNLYSFAKTVSLESSLPTINPNLNKKHTVFSMLKADETDDKSDFKNAFDFQNLQFDNNKCIHGSKVLPSASMEPFQKFPKNSIFHKKSMAVSKEYQNGKGKILTLNQKGKNTKINSRLSKKSFGILEVSTKVCDREIKKEIEEQVKFSLLEQNIDCFPDVCIDVKPFSCLDSKDIIDEINLISGEASYLSLKQKALKNEEIEIPKELKPLFRQSPFVRLEDCFHLIGKYYPKSEPCLEENQQSREFGKSNVDGSISSSEMVKLPYCKQISDSSVQIQNGDSSVHKPKSKKVKINQVKELPCMAEIQSESMKLTETCLPYAVKSKPNTKTQINASFNGTISTTSHSGAILPYAIKSKPITKEDSNSVTESSLINTSDSDTDNKSSLVYAIKSKPSAKSNSESPVITRSVSMPYKVSDPENVLLNSKLNTHTESQSKNKSKLVLESDQVLTKNVDDDSDFKFPVSKISNNISMSDIVSESSRPLAVKGSIDMKNGNKTKSSSSFNCTDNFGNNCGTESMLSILQKVVSVEEKDCTKLTIVDDTSNICPENILPCAGRGRKKKKGGFDFRSPINKKLNLLPEANTLEESTTKKDGEYQFHKLFTSSDTSNHITVIGSNLSNFVINPPAEIEKFDSKSKTVFSSECVNQDFIDNVLSNLDEENNIAKNSKAQVDGIDNNMLSKKISENFPSTLTRDSTMKINRKLGSRGLPASIGITESDCTSKINLPLSRKGTASKKRNRVSKPKVTTDNNKVKNSLSKEKVKTNKESVQSKVIHDTLKNFPVIENDLYDIVKRRTANKNISKSIGMMNTGRKSSYQSTEKASVCAGKAKLVKKNNPKCDLSSSLSNNKKHCSFAPSTPEPVILKESVGKQKSNVKSKPMLVSNDSLSDCLIKSTNLDAGHNHIAEQCKVEPTPRDTVLSKDTFLNSTTYMNDLPCFVKEIPPNAVCQADINNTIRVSSSSCVSEGSLSLVTKKISKEKSESGSMPPVSSHNMLLNSKTPVNELPSSPDEIPPSSEPQAVVNTIVVSSNNTVSKNPFSLVARGKKGKKFKDSNNFGFFSNKNTRRRRNDTETSLTSKTLSSKLSLKLNKKSSTVKVKNNSVLRPESTRKWKIDTTLYEENTPQDCSKIPANNSTAEYPLSENITIKVEPIEDVAPEQSNKMKKALSCFDFDENASVEPTNCLVYSSRRNRKIGKAIANNTKSTLQKSSKGKVVKQPKNRKKSSHFLIPKKDSRNSTRLKPYVYEKMASEFKTTPNRRDVNQNFTDMQKSPTITIKRDSKGQNCIVPNKPKSYFPNYFESIPETHSYTPPSTSALTTTSEKAKEKIGSSPDSKHHVPKIKLQLKTITTRSNEQKVVVVGRQLECIDLSSDDSDSGETKTTTATKEKYKNEMPSKTRRSLGGRNMRQNDSEMNLSKPFIPPILIKDIKKEKEDDYEQQSYVPPLKVNLTTLNVTECDRRIKVDEPKCEPLKLYRRSNNFYIDPENSSKRKFGSGDGISDHESVTKLKRGRGRPAKVRKHFSPKKDVSPLKNETSFNEERKVPAIRIPKRSAAESLLGIDKTNSFKPLSRKMRSNSAKASIGQHWSEVKIKEEPISDVEDCNPQNETSVKTTRRRNSLRCESFKKFFDSNSDLSSNDSESKFVKAKSPRKKKPETKVIKDSSETNKPRNISNRRTSAKASNFKKFFDSDKSNHSDSDDCKMVFAKLTPKTKRATRRRRKSSSAIPKCRPSDGSSVLACNPCTVSLQRLLPSDLEKHTIESQSENTVKESKKKSLVSSTSVPISDDGLIPDSVKIKSSFDMKGLTSEILHRKVTDESLLPNMPPSSHVDDKDMLMCDVLHRKAMRDEKREPNLMSTSSENALTQLIPDTNPVNLRKLTPISIESSVSENLLEKVRKENQINSTSTAPPLNVDNVKCKNVKCKLEKHVESPQEKGTKENKISSELVPFSAPSPGNGVKRVLESSPRSKLFIGSDLVNNSYSPDAINNPADSSQNSVVFKKDQSESSTDKHKLFLSRKKDVNSSHFSVDIASPTESREAGTSVIPKERDQGNLFDKIAEKMNNPSSEVFDSMPQNSCFSKDNYSSIDPQGSLSFPTLTGIEKYDNTPSNMHQPFKSVTDGFEGGHEHMVSCFSGYGLQSECRRSSPACVSGRMIPTRENVAYSCFSNDYSSPIEVGRPQPSFNPPEDSNYNSPFDDAANNAHKTLRTQSKEFDNAKWNYVNSCFPSSNNSHYEQNRTQQTFSMEQNKFSNSFTSDIPDNLITNRNVFNETRWQDVNMPCFPRGSSFNETSQLSPQDPLDSKKCAESFNNGRHRNLETPDKFLNRTECVDASNSHFSNYNISPCEHRRSGPCTPVVQEKYSSSLERNTERIFKEHTYSPGNHYSMECPSPVRFPTQPGENPNIFRRETKMVCRELDFHSESDDAIHTYDISKQSSSEYPIENITRLHNDHFTKEPSISSSKKITSIDVPLKDHHLSGSLSNIHPKEIVSIDSVEEYDIRIQAPTQLSEKVRTLKNESNHPVSEYHLIENSADNQSKEDENDQALKSFRDMFDDEFSNSLQNLEPEKLLLDTFPSSFEPTSSENHHISSITDTNIYCNNVTTMSSATRIGEKDAPANNFKASNPLQQTQSYSCIDFTCLTEDPQPLDFGAIGYDSTTAMPHCPQDNCNTSVSAVGKSQQNCQEASEVKPDYCVEKENQITNSLIVETFPSSNSPTTTSSTTDAVEDPIPFETPFKNNVIPFVAVNSDTTDESSCFTQFPTSSNSSPVNQTFLPTLMVGESVVVPQPNFFFNDTPIIISRNSCPGQDYVNIFQNSVPLTSNSVSAMHHSDSRSNQEVNNLKQPFNDGEDILSKIVKECDIGEEFDNLDSPAEFINVQTLNDAENDSTPLDSMIHSFYGDETLYGLNPSNNETFCSDTLGSHMSSDKVDRNFSEASPKSNSEQRDCSEGSSYKNIAIIPPSQLSDLPSSEKSTLVFEPCDSIDERCTHISANFNNELKVESVPHSDSHQPLEKDEEVVCRPNFSPPNVIKGADPKSEPKRRTRDDFDNSSDEPSSDDSQNSDCEKSELSGNKEEFHSALNNSTCDSQQLLDTPGDIVARLPPPTCDKLESTPSANRQDNRNFLSEELGVSPINKDNLLTSDTKKKRKLSFNGATVPPKKSSKRLDRKAGGYKRFWETTLLADQGSESELNTLCSEIDGPTLENSRGFKVNLDDMGDVRVRHEVQHLTVMSLEVHVNTRNDLRPDPRFDAVAAVFYCIYNDVGFFEQESVGIIAVNNSLQQRSFRGTSASLKNYLSLVPGVKNSNVFCVQDENELFLKLISIVREWDPDILVGYEIQMASWGYLIERSGILSINLVSMLSRLYNTKESKLQRVEEDHTVTDQTADLDKLNIPGRIILNLWRLLRKEVNLNVYTFENVYYHVLHRRTPLYPFQDLTAWFVGGLGREMVVRYYVTRILGSVQFLEKFDIIRRTSELARLFGIQFYEVLSRGSQFRVESMMLRTAAPMRYIPVSPSVQQRSRMSAPESVPLILEPESKFYTDPVVVLDFQSLYPSMIMAYNYCFSTCLGRIEHFGKDVPFDFGCTSLSVPTGLLSELARQDNIHFSPQGIAFVKAPVRRGILPLMLEEILDTRVMVKQSMKKIKNNTALKKLLDARQMGLKLIANVTYGYTGANFSGRMPCVEVADSIVGKARETLERAIQLIENTPEWDAKVVYGDTDSLFILLAGRSKEEAFKIGQDIADAVTIANPKPVKLKFEKVYLPCVLQTKKRYVGFMYETVDQRRPVFDAKGIETVRRDTCPATAKILEKSLKILFRTYDVSLVQKYVQKQLRKFIIGRVSIIDCIFAKEYRGIPGYRPSACVPALEIAKKRLAKDPRSEPRTGERVPYVVVYGFPGLPIIRLVREPTDLLHDLNLRINATYYITRVISPPLERVFSLIGADVKKWYTSIAHTVKLNLPMLHDPSHHRETITQYFATRSCPSCEKSTTSAVCDACRQEPQETTVTLYEKIRKWERTEQHLNQICMSCTKSNNSVDHCASMDCPILFKLNLAKKDLSQAPYLRKVLAHELF